MLQYASTYDKVQWISLGFYVWLTVMCIVYYVRDRTEFRMFIAGIILSWAIVNISFYVLVITSRPILPDDFVQTFSAMTKIQGVILLLATLWRLDKERS